MRVLLIGKGGREHALAWKIRCSSLVSELFIWPGNPAMASLGQALDLSPEAPLAQLVVAAQQARVDLVVCGPEGPLEAGLADLLKKATPSIPCFGPEAAAAALESSKAFAKEVMQSAGIPTASYQIISNADAERVRSAALVFCQERGGVVIKASGLAAGKGVFVCTTPEQIGEAVTRLYQSEMATAATTIVLEEILRGRECSYFSLLGADGATGLGFAVDHKRLEDGDRGPNTGGMGCYAPVPWLPLDAEAQVVASVVEPLQNELRRRGITYTGCLYVGLMWSEQGPKVVEFNVRLGDPEAQVLAVYDDRDWLALMAAKAGLKVPAQALAAATAPIVHKQCAVAVVMASAGYPYGGQPEESALLEPRFLDVAQADTVQAFAASIRAEADGQLRTGSGRVLTLVARGDDFARARDTVYEAAEQLAGRWPGCRFRRDIAGGML